MKHRHIYPDIFCASTKLKSIFVLALLITLSVFCLAPQTHAGPAPIETYFVPLPELQVQSSLKAVDTNDQIGDVMRSIISIAATGDNTIITYDHWEDGYELDLANPVQASTEVWGDSDPLNGIPPGFGTDVINAGDVISLVNNVSLPRNPAQVLYDGRDKFGGTRAVAVTRASWALNPGVVLAGAVEVYPLRDYGLRFEVPVGEDLSSDQMFQYVSLMVLAAADGTDLQIDIDGDGTTDITQTLNQGESYQVDGGIDTGASVTASKPVQAHIITGDIGARYESRFYTLYPVENWSDSYYSAVGTAADGDETYVFVYNPNGSAITINYETRIGTGSFAVAAGSAYRYLMPSQSGAHFFTSDGSTFFAIATVGADPGANLVHDWGFSLLPESYLTPMAVVGWGPGSDDLSQNGSPVWVTAVAATTVYVDYDGDSATGPLIDANGDHYDVAINISMLESARVYDNTDNDQTGMRLYTLDGTLITAAWGQDPANSQGGAPYLDLGTSVLPFPIASVEKTSALVVDDNSNGLVDWGDSIEYTITVNNDGVVVLGGVVALDPLPAGVTYVSGSTTLNGAPVADETVPPAVTEYPLDEGGLSMPVIPPIEFSTITFQVTVDFGTTTITNSVSINTDQEILTTDDTIDVNTPDITACSLEFTDAVGVSQATYPENGDVYVTVDDNDRNTDAGTIQSFTVVVINPDAGDVETITLIETGNDTGVFRNSAALPSSATGGLSDEDGTLYAVAGNTVQVAYTDPVFGDTCSDTAGITIPTEIKPLYLSEPGQGMDRVDPVATGDSTTATSAELSLSSTTFTQTPVMCKDFVMPAGGAVTVTNYINVSPSSGSVTRSIAAGSDDAEEEGPDGTSPGTVWPDSSDVELVEDFESPSFGTMTDGFRFTNIDVPNGATITSAKITFRTIAPDSPNTNNNTANLLIEGQAADDPTTFTTASENISTRSRTTASVNWVPTAWTIGNDYDTPDIFTIVQELVNRPGWASGNSMVLIVTGSGSRSAESWDNAGSNPPQLTIEYTTDSMPANPDINATIKHDGTTIETLTNPAVTDLGVGIYRLDWTDVISSDTTVLAGEQVELEITTAEAGLNFEILYDSSTYPSKILLPTTTVILIHVDTLAAYDAPYAGGSPITDAENGAALYLRATISDPFGTDDITDLDLSISDPCGGGPLNVTLDDGDVVATGACSKTYEYVWNTTMCQGNYDIIATANEGTEGITDSAAIRVTLSFTDTGTAGSSAFTDGSGNPVSNYDADATICVQVTDMDQNSNPGVSETVTAVITGPQGDSETMTLSETGADTGIFRACIASSSSLPGAPDDGSLYALPGDVLVARYTDPDDPPDSSDDTALVNTPAADMTISKLLVDPLDGTAQVNDLIRFDIVVGSPGPTDITSFTATDTFDAGCLSYDAASITPDSIGGGTITWDETELGTLPVGSSATISVWFTADAACAPTVNTVSAVGQDEFGTAVSAGPATAQVTITRPALSITKSLISPNPGPAYVGDPVTFRINLENTGTSVITTLPLADTFSAACYDFQSATAAPDGIGTGSLLWDNRGPLGVGASTSLDVTLTVTGECNPAQNTADVGFAVDENGDSLPAVQDSAGLQTIGGKIGDRVWNDRNGDGVQDAGEGGMANVIVFVDLNDDGTRDPGEPYDTTDVNGAYDITDLAAGTYSVRVDAATLPAGAVLTGGSNPLSVTVADGEDFNTADFGYQGNASIGDFIWHDTNGDGNPDGGELGLANVTVFLDMDGDGVLDAGEPFAVTDGGGNYDFTNLVAGDYLVDVDDTTLPPNHVLTTGAASLSVTLAAGQEYNDADFGYRQQGGVNGHLFEDVDGDGVQDAGESDLAGVDVIITDSNGDPQTITTDADGDYQAFLPPGATILDVEDTTLPPNAYITTANDPQTVTVNAGAFTDSSDVGYQFTIPSTMKLRTGSFTGNATAGTTITGLGFEPDLVIIKVADDTKEGVIRTSSMSGDLSKSMGGATALTAGLIQSLDADGFTIGADDRVNKSGKTYHWIAFEAGDGEMTVDSYTGTGADNTSVSGVGFQPDYVIVLPAINKEPVHRSSEQSGDSTMLFKNTASVTNHIQALEADGFQVGDDDRVNKLNETYHYIAWKEVAGKTAVGSYNGNDTDNTEISGLGFAPEYVIIKQDDSKEAVHRPDSLSGDNTLWFASQAASADMIQELQSDGFQIGLDDNVNASSEIYFWAAFAGSHLTISSAADQAFFVADPATVIRTITITEDNLDPTITATNDIRIRIPAGFNMTWDTSVTTASIGGMAAAKVSMAVTYEDGGRTLVLDVASDFAASDQITVSLLRFANFTAGSPADNLELEVDAVGTPAAVDDKTIAIAAATISSAANQTFSVGDPARDISTITITEGSISPTITAGDDIRIRIPGGFNMIWDTLDLTAVIGGSAAGKVSTTVSYEDGGRTLVLDVTSDFAPDDQITISGLSFENFSAISAADNLELEVKNDGVVQNTDDKTIAIADLSISSAENQEFIVGDSATAVSTITVTDGTTAALITATNDIRIQIPSDLYMLWDTSDLDAVIGGSAASKVLTGVSYEDGGKTLVLDVTSDFAAGDQITISGLSFSDFSAASYGDRLELEVFDDGVTAAEDDKWKAIGGEPSAGSMLVYGEVAVATPRYRTWEGEPSLSFSAEGSALPANVTISWVVLKPSPNENEMIMAAYASDGTLYVQTWDGSSWTSNWSTFMDLPASYRGFDIAYEQSSGDAMVVFSDDATDTLKYRQRVDGIWDSADQTVTGLSLGDEANWVRAESRPGSDDIFVAAQTNSKTLHALRWDGTGNSWGDQIQTTASVKNAATEAFDIAFESATGDAFLVFGDGATNVWYREFTTSWQAETLAYTLPDDVFWLTAAYDPQATSSNIAIATILENSTFEFGAWNGAGWAARPTAVTAPNRDNRFIDVAFESNTGQAMYAFSQNVAADDKKKLAWRSWTSGGGFSSVTVLDGVSDEINFVQLKADPNSNDMMAVYADKDVHLYHRYWNGSSWTALDTTLEATVSDADKNEAFMFVWNESPPTAISLISFTATGQNNTVQVAWQTAQEINNFGFNLYRSGSFAGPYYKINPSLIPGLTYSVMGKSYAYTDETVTPGQLYYYRLEDIDVNGTRTFHGPVCVDWDGDGLPDDWEIAYGLNAGAADANLDSDGDGLTNLEEYQLGTDPFNPDSDGDGIADGDEDRKIDRQAPQGTRALTRGVEILAADETGITFELRTEAFEIELIKVAGQEFERLQISEYIHGYTRQTGKPRMPLKGILIDIPAGRSAALTVLDTEVELYEGYQVYPVSENVVDVQGEVASVGESFVWDQAAYALDVFYPDTVAELGRLFTFRGQGKQQVMLYPLNFNPATGQIWLHRRIRLRVDYVDDPPVVAERSTPVPWKPPSGENSAGALDLTLANLPLSLYPFSPMLWVLEMLAQPVWAASGVGLPFGSAAYKIMLSEEGIYRLTRSYLAGGGLDVDDVDLSQVRIYNLGREIAVYVYDPNGDHHFDSSDYIEFYGQAVPARQAKYAGENVYWLVLSGGSGSPRRMLAVDGAPAGGAVAGSHRHTVHHERDVYYVGLAPGGDAVDRWYFANFVLGTDFTGSPSPLPVNFTFALPGVAGPADLKIWLWGYYDTAHEVAVYVNGAAAGTYHWSGIEFNEIAIEGLNLVDGNNTVTLACNTALDGILVDWFEVTYPRSFAAVANTLKFSHDSGFGYAVTGFSANDHLVYDITDAADVRRVVNFTSVATDPPTASPTYTLTFESPESGEANTYLVLTPAAVKTPLSISEDDPSDLGDPSNGADYILITHRDLGWDFSGNPQAWLTDLTALRENQGLRVMVVDGEDIFDEFGHGLATPEAIRDFLSYAYDNWSPPAPKFVLLVGDTTYDYKDNFGRGTVNYVPSYLAFTEYMGETVTDEWYARISGDDAVPDLYIGRLTAASVADAAVMVGKILTYENAANTKTWQKNVVLISDDQTEDYEAIFETISDEAAALLPAGMNSPFKGYLNDYPDAADLNADIKSGIDAGALMVNYSGHASLQRWAAEGIFQNSDVAELTNAGMYPFVVNMSCLTGYFAYLDAYTGSDLSLAEALLQADGQGAVAALMPTGMTPPEGQQILSAALVETVFREDVRQLGPAISAAKQTLLANGGAAYEELSETFLLFGDPAMALKVPLPRRPSGLTAEGRLSGIFLQWQPAGDCNGAPVAGYNLYRSPTPTGNYTRVNSELISATQYVDPAVETAAAVRQLLAPDTPYYYTVTAVAADSDQSVQSEMVSSALLNTTTDEDTASDQDADEASDQGGGGGGGCFIQTTEGSLGAFWLIFIVMGVLAAVGFWEPLRRRIKT